MSKSVSPQSDQVCTSQSVVAMWVPALCVCTLLHLCRRSLSQCPLYQDAQLIRVTCTSPDDLKMLSVMEDSGDLEVISTTMDTSDVLVLNVSTAEVMGELDAVNLTYEVLLVNVQGALDAESDTMAEALRTKPCDYGPCFDWHSYHRAASIIGYLDSLRGTDSRVTVTVETIGKSAENRPLRLVKIISTGNHSRAAWLDGGSHAREWITPAAAAYVAGRVVASLRAGETTFAGLDYYILPLANPDGYEYSHNTDRLWRKNRSVHKGAAGCVGTDLNRNWGHRWGGSESRAQPCSPNYRGPRPFSEPETKAVAAYILEKRAQIKAYITLHSYGQKIIFPWGYTYSAPPEYQEILALARNMANSVKINNGAEYKYGTASQMYYVASGGSQDWAMGAARIKYAYTMELRDTGNYGFYLPISQIVPTSKDAFEAFRVLIQQMKVK